MYFVILIVFEVILSDKEFFENIIQRVCTNLIISVILTILDVIITQYIFN